ncbi:MAG: ribosome silencing factor [Bacteroidales bacterium]|jgi:ribosome-associated protein|nr:ribosome silencing factor [Bacteroidales bacterium]MBQ3982751.1 ribosome silencing factor [Bacteroidales bacterium]MBR3987229.1 ribosome silencing factor [Bacteroidales bacterium]
MTESEVLAKLAAQALDEKKGIDVQILDLRGLPSAPCAFFVIASGNVPSHVSSLCDHVHEVVKKATGLNPSKLEGYNNAEWILMDYFDVVVHIFQQEKRNFYRLEQLWADASRLEFTSK